MTTSIPFRGLMAASAVGLTTFLLSSCATTPTSPIPAHPIDSNSTTVDEFFTPPPTGNADDYYVLTNGDDDIEYSYFLDEQDYFNARDAKGDDHDHEGKYKFSNELFKNGHRYGDHNHIHIHLKGPHHYRGSYIGEREFDWTDSLALTSVEKHSVDTAMVMFHQCADAAIDSFKVQLKPYRDHFRTRKLAILAKLDSGVVTRDSARTMLDSAIALYLTETNLLRTGFTAELKVCLTELDAFVKTRLTADQYAIWTRHRGW